MFPEALSFLLVGGLLLALGALGGIMGERRRLQFVMREQAARNSELRHRVGETEELLGRARAENSTVSSFLVVLPDVVRQLNSHLTKRSIPPLLVSTLEHIFEPAHILIYARGVKDDFVLTHWKGIPESLARGHHVRLGEGRVGLAASSQMTMDHDDLQSETLLRRFAPSASELPGVALDLIAPMVHEGTTLGVICVGRASRRQGDEKRMIKLVADLGSLAFANADMFMKLENTANADSLTNLSTKRFLNLRLGELTHRAEKTHTPLSLIIFDIDHFKKFNDTFGHPAGDSILKVVAALIKGQLREDDIAARYGGEEFVIVLPNTVKEDATRIAEKIRKAIEKHPFRVSSDVIKPVSVTISGGVAGHLVDGKSSHEILSAADQALYLAKEQGRNRIIEYRSRYLSDDETEIGVTV